MKKVALFMSDFHLGQNNRMEEFHADNEFAELLGRLSLEHADDEVDLVLLGDVMDLWTTITSAAEENAETVDEVDLYLPVQDLNDPAEINRAGARELAKARAVADSHPGFFEALGRFLVDAPDRRRVLYMPGNHDHSVVYAPLQDLIRQRILTPSVLGRFYSDYVYTPAGAAFMTPQDLQARIDFPLFYKDDRELLVYAEHGNQLTYGGIFRYWDASKEQSTFGAPGAECPGYVEFKLVSSRLERSAPELNGILMGAFNPANWPGLFWWLLLKGKILTLGRLQKFWIQYENVEPSQAAWGRVQWARSELPASWKTVLYLLKTRIWSVTKDEFNDQLLQFFDPRGPGMEPLCGGRLDPQRIKTVILGHSHQTRDVNLPNLEGGKYYNTGSWLLRYENRRRIVEQVWVSISVELPVTVVALSPDCRVTVRYRSGKEMVLDVADREVLGGLSAGDNIYIELDEEKKIRSVARDPVQRMIIDRHMVRRRVELPRSGSSPMTTDGQALNPLLREMKGLRVGDLVLFHWNFVEQLGRLLRERRMVEFFRVIPEMVKGAFNRWGTSSYWNHIAMVFGTTSEKREAEYYNDPLIIEAVPETGVSIHTPQHYLTHPLEWNIAVLRVVAPLLERWETRARLRRLALGLLEAEYDVKAIARQTVAYAARTMDAKGRSIVGGVVKGAIAGVVLLTGLLLWLGVYNNWEAWGPAVEQQAQDWMRWVQGAWQREFVRPWTGRDADIVVRAAVVLKGAFCTILLVVGAYAVVRLLRLVVDVWVAAAAAVGALVGAVVVPIMADFAEGWTQKTSAQRWGFTGIWFLPLLLVFPIREHVLLHESMKAGPFGFEEKLQASIIAVLCAVLLTLWAARILSQIADPIIDFSGRVAEGLRGLVRTVFHRLGWAVFQSPANGKYSLHKQFICSGLVQEALWKTAREENVAPDSVIVNDQWGAVKGRSLAEQAAILKNTLPKHFALAGDKFRWTYLLFDGRPTPDPSPSHKAQAYTPPLNPRRGALSEPAVRAIQLAFTGVFCAVLAAFAGGYFSYDVTMLLGLPFLEEQARPLFIAIAVVLGVVAMVCARSARRELALRPEMRGSALTFWGGTLGALAFWSALINSGFLAFAGESAGGLLLGIVKVLLVLFAVLPAVLFIF